jgi:tRNA (guanine37-N1)-methyltransferase
MEWKILILVSYLRTLGILGEPVNQTIRKSENRKRFSGPLIIRISDYPAFRVFRVLRKLIMTIHILTIFPEMVRAVFEYGVIGRAIKKGILKINPVDLRDFTVDKHRSVDDKPFGGGPGMVMRVDVVDRAISEIRNHISDIRKRRIVLLSPQGKLFSQETAREYSELDSLILISGRYEGVDERVREHLVDEELSIGEYVLSGGEIPAMAVADAVARLLPGVVGDPESLINESFSVPLRSNLRSAKVRPSGIRQYTQPAEYKGWRVPEVLRSGDHGKIKKWREARSLCRRGRKAGGVHRDGRGQIGGR